VGVVFVGRVREKDEREGRWRERAGEGRSPGEDKRRAAILKIEANTRF